MNPLHKYWQLLSVSFQSLFEYRVDFSVGIINRSLGYLVLFLFWVSLARSGVDVRPYTTESLGLYYFFIALIGAVIYFDSNSLAWEIREGYASVALVKPMNYLIYFFSASFAQRVINIVVGLIIFAIIISLGFHPLLGQINWLAFIITITLAIIGNYLLYYTIGLAAIWTQQVHGISALVSVGSGLVSGSMIPIDLLPSYLTTISWILPFRHFIFLPIKIFLNQTTSAEILLGILIETLWVVIFYFLYRLVWSQGAKRLEGVGI